jgi:hypothetical protein
MLSKYKNILGKPSKGIHKYRFLGVAIADVLLTIFAAGLISYFLKYNFFLVLIILFLTGIILHRLFSVRSTIDKLLFH